MNQRNLLKIVLIVFVLAAFLYSRYQRAAHRKNEPRQEQETHRKTDPSSPADDPAGNTGLNRRVASLVYSKHARCRMACRHIDESEVKEILADGQLNAGKSEPASGRGDAKYALEGTTHDNQHVRIIFAQDAGATTVVTVIDLDREWQCDCN